MASALDLLRRASGVLSPAQIQDVVRGEMRATTLREPPDWLWDAWGGGRSSSGPRVSAGAVLGIDAVYAAVSLLAGAVGSLPMIVYKGEGAERKRAKSNALWHLLHEEPNTEQAADAFYENVMAHLALWGNFCAEKVKRNGRVVELWGINPNRVRIIRDPKTLAKRFEIDGTSGTLDEKRILHIPGFGYDGLKGMSVIEMCRDVFGTALAQSEFESNFYASDATPGGVLSVQGTLTPESASRIREQWEALHSGGDRRRIAVLEGGATWESLSAPLKDLQFIERSRFTVNQIARMFGIPPEMIGGDHNGSLTYSTVEGQALQFVTFSLRRWLVRIEKGLLRDPDIFGTGTLYPEFLVEGLLRGDSQSRAAFYQALYAMKAITPNEIRERENMPPLDGGDEFPEPPAPIDPLAHLAAVPNGNGASAPMEEVTP